MTHPVHQYPLDVVAGRVAAPPTIVWACQRHLDEVETSGRGWRFDEEEATRALSFWRILRHFEGEWAGRVVELEPWQQWAIGAVWGFRREDGTRRFRRMYLRVQRKNGKTLLAAGVGHMLLVLDGERGGQIWSAATKRDQAGLSLRAAWAMRSASKELRQRIRTVPQHGRLDTVDYRARLIHDGLGATWATLARDSDTVDGLNPHGIIVDEVHAHRDGSVIDVLESGIGARRQPLTVMITTAGLDGEGYGRRVDDAMRRVVDPDSGVDDETTWVGIWEVPEGQDPMVDHSTWILANPNLGVSVKPERLEEQVRKAESLRDALDEVLCKHFGQWRSGGGGWIDLEAWGECGGPYLVGRPPREAYARALEDLAGGPAYAGLDLSTSQDLTALVLVVERDEIYHLLPWIWIPEEGLDARVRADGVPYRQWVEEGWIHVTPGDAIDYDHVEAVALDVGARYGVRQLAYDPYQAQQMALHLQDEGMEVVPTRQGYTHLSEPTREIQRLVAQRRIAHHGHPVLRWCAGNLTVKYDPGGSVRPVKPAPKSGKRVDPLVAAIMALGRALLSPAPKTSVYEEYGEDDWDRDAGEEPAPPARTGRRSIYEEHDEEDWR